MFIKENITCFCKDRTGLSTTYSCKHQYSIFSGVFIFSQCVDYFSLLYFSSVISQCMDYFSLLSPPGFCDCVFIPNKCIRPQPLQIGLPKSPPSALLHPQQLHRHTSAPTSSYLWKVSSQTLLKKTAQVTFSGKTVAGQHSTYSFMERLSL